MDDAVDVSRFVGRLALGQDVPMPPKVNLLTKEELHKGPYGVRRMLSALGSSPARSPALPESLLDHRKRLAGDGEYVLQLLELRVRDGFGRALDDEGRNAEHAFLSGRVCGRANTVRGNDLVDRDLPRHAVLHERDRRDLAGRGQPEEVHLHGAEAESRRIQHVRAGDA